MCCGLIFLCLLHLGAHPLHFLMHPKLKYGHIGITRIFFNLHNRSIISFNSNRFITELELHSHLFIHHHYGFGTIHICLPLDTSYITLLDDVSLHLLIQHPACSQLCPARSYSKTSTTLQAHPANKLLVSLHTIS